MASVPGIERGLKAMTAVLSLVSAAHTTWFRVTSLPVTLTRPPGFQNTAEASSASPTKAEPMPVARALTPILSS
jgi:hypothetical protein